MRLRPLLLLAALAVPSFALAEGVLLHHQGRLLDGSDQPVNGNRDVTVSLFTAASGGVAKWTETYTVSLFEGYYAITLGATSNDKKELPAETFDGPLWLGVSIDDVDMLPRGAVGVTPYAVEALRAGDAASLGGVPADRYVQLEAFEALQAEIEGGLIQEGGIETLHIKNGAITAEKLASDAINPSLFPSGSLEPGKLSPCPEGQILKVQSGAWQCSFDTGAGGTLTFNVLSPIEQIPGNDETPPTVQIKDGGIGSDKLAADAVDADKLATDPTSLAKVSGGSMVIGTAGGLGIGEGSPAARLHVAEYPAAGIAGVGTTNYNADAMTISLTGGSFADQVQVGDAIQLGTTGWRTITSVSPTSVGINQPYTAGFSGNWTYRTATLRVGSGVVLSPLGDLGIGTTAPRARLDVDGKIRSKNARVHVTATNSITTTSGSWVDMPNMSANFTVADGASALVLGTIGGIYLNSTDYYGYFRLLVDGNQVARGETRSPRSSSGMATVTLTWLGTNLKAGQHTAKIQWYRSAGTLYVSHGSSDRSITVAEL